MNFLRNIFSQEDTNTDNVLRLKHFRGKPNAGDQFSVFLAKKYFSENIISNSDKPLKKPNLLLLGSILQWADSNSVICGAGFISNDSKLKRKPIAINCIRGPLSDHLLIKQGFSETKKYADPGVLANKFYTASITRKYKIGIIPHFFDLENPWLRNIEDSGIKLINVLTPIEDFFTELANCESILSSSLHGLIFAHSLAIPASWIVLSDKLWGKDFKFHDYYFSLGTKESEIPRFKISPDTDPYSIAKNATLLNQNIQIEIIEEAINTSKKQLKLD